MFVPFERLAVPVYCIDRRSPVSVHSLRNAACSVASSPPDANLCSGISHAAHNDRNMSDADDSAKTVMAMFVRLRQSKQFTRVMPVCKRCGAFVAPLPPPSILIVKKPCDDGRRAAGSMVES